MFVGYRCMVYNGHMSEIIYLLRRLSLWWKQLPSLFPVLVLCKNIQCIVHFYIFVTYSHSAVGYYYLLLFIELLCVFCVFLKNIYLFARQDARAREKDRDMPSAGLLFKHQWQLRLGQCQEFHSGFPCGWQGSSTEAMVCQPLRGLNRRLDQNGAWF